MNFESCAKTRPVSGPSDMRSRTRTCSAGSGKTAALRIRSVIALTAVAFGLWARCDDASAVVVNIDATVSGCDSSHCNGSHPAVGSVVAAVYNPVQVTLGPGTYVLTNATGTIGANPSFDAWRFDGGAHWTWEFMVLDEATKSVMVQACCVSAVYSNEASAAADSFAKGYLNTITLTTQKTLDFVIEDSYLADNAGGAAVNIAAAVPEPEAYALFTAGLLLVSLRMRQGRQHPQA